MNIVCPCCKASTENSSQCRRCKCDLSLLVQYHSELAQHARRHLQNRDYAAAWACYTAAKQQASTAAHS